MPLKFDIESGRFIGESDDNAPERKKIRVIEVLEPNTILSGKGEPSADLGNKGDFYIETASWEIYGPKVEGWGVGTPLIGQSGKDGKDGDDGKDGAPVNGEDGVGISDIKYSDGVLAISLTNDEVRKFTIGAPKNGVNGTGISSITKAGNKINIALTDGRVQSIDFPKADDPRNIELQANETHVQWRRAGEVIWTDLYEIPKAKSKNSLGGGGRPKLVDLVAKIQAGANITITSDLMADTLTISSGGGGGVTVGVSDGTFKVDDYGGNPALTLEAALAVSKRIDFLPGNYTWTEPLEYETDEALEIVGRGFPQFTIAHSGAVAAFDIVTPGNCVIEDISFRINTWVASQKVVNIEPPATSFQTVDNRVSCTFVFGTGVEDDFAPTFSAGNEMVGVLITQGKGCTIDSVFYPNKGVACGRFKNGFGNIAKENRVQNGSIFYLPSIGDAQRRPCYIGIHFENETAPIHHDNVYENLGLIDNISGRVDRRLSHAVLFQIPNVGGGTYEYGHEVSRDNTFRDCLTDTTCIADYRGVRWLMMTGDYFCFNGTATTNGSGFVRITDANADGTGTNAYAYQSQIVGCHFHNPGTSGAAAIYINSATNLAIQSSIFHELYCTAPIVIDPKTSSDNVGTLTIQGCKASWPTGTPNNRWFINRTGSDANACKKLYLDGNICASGDDTKPVTGFYNGTVFATTHNVQETPITNSPIEVVRNKTYVIVQKATYSGRITEATTQCLSGTCTATFYINGTPLGGTANSVSSSEQSQAHTSANEFVAGDTISMTITSSSACLDLSYTLTAVRGLI